MLSLKRCAAYLMDIGLLFVILAPLAFLVERWLDITPQTAPQVWIAAILSFSLPAWLYFLLSDHARSGATVGKRIIRLRVISLSGDRIGPFRALARTAVKLLPWEVAHVFGFALAKSVGPDLQTAGLIAANILALLYLAVLLSTGGRRSAHDLIVKTEVVPLA